MTVRVTCKRCHELITAEDEDELVAQVETHARDHGGAHGEHIPTPERVLTHLHRQDAQEQD